MNVRTKLRTAAAAAAIAVMILGSPSGLALAAPIETSKQSCQRRGYNWNDTLGCNDKKCEYNGKTYGAADTINIKIHTRDGFRNGIAYCNGYTGNWVVL